ncbi:T9SS type A sorting domain-containing protein [Flavobacterium cucumis]|uniref:Por secretion system C-terminal sorting domain-containing protein n=1 Tax=Flavobacterium cucumis TaxID=416016 RepID=A0A1M7ZUU3_9FLAO|nr:T9SS type A sorting domain-containing protein [Flavobacterium cucumis]SHO72638.1 Por secretion system C-terminal sorting domain-containing protein [Flavobacterium cucumis]
MKKITFILFSFCFLLSNVTVGQVKKKVMQFGKEISPKNINSDGYIRCLTDEYEEYLQSIDPKRASRAKFEAWLAPLVEEQKQLQQVASQSGGIVYIPVVVHVIHNGDAYGTNENITDEQVQSQITVMTQDFRRMSGTPGFNTNPVGADTQIEFVLAKVDPNGNPTNGINRVNLCEASWSTADIDAVVKPSTIWDATQYMNMWSVNFSNGSLLGYAQFPSNSGLSGLNTSGGAATTDGVVAGYRFFGSSSLAPGGNYGAPYDKGRTMTHEVGHFLGLRHIWGDGDCTADDFCADTPNAGAANEGCPTIDSCPGGGNDMVQNYMDYTNDTCMNIFTLDQKARIVAVMNNSPRRASLKTSTKNIAIPLFANDAEVKIENSCSTVEPTCDAPNPTSPAKRVLLYNRGTSNLTSATLNYNMNGGTSYNQNWTGNLAPNRYAVVTLTNSTGNGTLNVSVTIANGVADQRSSNNTASKTFGTTASLAYANATSFTFNLFGDSFGSETTWTLKNQAGTTLYSGGPYTDQQGGGTYQYVTNQVWNLPANGCYYLSVNDSYGDGLFDGVGQGYYTVTAGASTVVNVTDFVASGNPDFTFISRESYFTNNAALSTDDFGLLDNVNLYPNPSNDNFTINLPVDIERKGTVEIYNSIGQQITVKSIQSDADLNVNVSSLSNGVYFLKLNFAGSTKTMKFIKN